MDQLIEILSLYHKENEEFISELKLIEKLNINREELRALISGFFDYHPTYGYNLNKKYAIGVLDVKKTVAFLLQDPKDLIIEKRDLKGGMDKDLVLVQKHKKFNEVIKVIKHNLEQLVVNVKKNKKGIWFKTRKNLEKSIIVNGFPEQLVDGHVILVEVTEITKHNIVTQYKEIIGHKNDPDIDILEIIFEYNWPLEFPKEVLDSLMHIHIDLEHEKKTRKDLTQELVVTIDGEDAKDLDDAISLTKTEDGNDLLSIHIADVSYYVKEGSLVDQEAYKRATSVYLADRVIPMLPHILSNDLCSLNPFEEKYAITCQMTLDQQSKVIDYQIFPSIIETKRRLTYTEVNDLINHQISLNDEKIDTMILRMNEISQKLKAVRKKRGAIEFKSSELKFQFDDQGKINGVSERITDEGEELIESFMLLANETVAFHFHQFELPGIYRIHEKPDADKMEKSLDLLHKLGQPVDYKRMLKPSSIQKLTENSLNSPYEYIVHNTLLRSMQKAKYSPNSLGHFGLGARYYAHFTSPIRRYPDLLLHRMIRSFLFEPKNLKQKIKHFNAVLSEAAEHTSANERKAIMMERDVDKLKSCEFMLDKIGQNFNALIVQMMGAGMFIKLENGIEGFIALKDLSGYFEYNEETLTYFNHKGTQYRLGDEVLVSLIDVNMMERQMNYTIIKKIEERSK